ncbi:MAG: NusG domain II-containing protein [Clostridium sp.]
MKKKKNLIAILILALIIVLSLFSLKMINRESKTLGIVKVIKNNEVIKTIDLSKVKESYEFEVKGDNEESNTIKVENTGVSIVSASCKDKICIHTGKIKDSSLPIVCLPNKLIIKFESTKESEDDIDGKTF